MSFKVEQLEEKNMVKLVIEASAEEFEAGLNTAYNKNKNMINEMYAKDASKKRVLSFEMHSRRGDMKTSRMCLCRTVRGR